MSKDRLIPWLCGPWGSFERAQVTYGDLSGPLSRIRSCLAVLVLLEVQIEGLRANSLDLKAGLSL